MAINVTKLQPSHFVSTETRQKIHDLTDKPGGMSFQERADFATERGERNVTKYWSVPTVLAACDRWAIEPVLGKGGKKFVRQNGGLSYAGRNGFGGTAGSTPTPTPETKAVKSNKYAKPPVTVGTPKQPGSWTEAEASMRAGATQPGGQETVTPVPQPQGEGDEAERARKLAALEGLIDRKISDRLAKSDESIKDLIAGVSQAAVGAILDTKGQQLLAKVQAEANERLAEAVALIDEARPVVITVQDTSGKVLGTVDGEQHAAFPRVLKLARAGKNIAMIGPTGCGKTHLAEQVAKVLGRAFATISCTMGASETKLIGGLLPTGEGGKFEPFLSDFVRLFRDGGVFLLDEMDSIDPNVLLIVNQALANGHIDLPLLGAVRRHADFVCLAALNTYGTGFDRMYVGRSQLDEASLDRFRIGQVEMDYDRNLETKLVGVQHKPWLNRAWQIRDAIRQHRLQRNMSTRFILDGRDMLDAGDTEEQVLTAFASGWSQDELNKVGIQPVPLY